MPVDIALQRADELVQRYRVDSVPRFVVNGKYLADVSTAGSPERLISLIGDLAAHFECAHVGQHFFDVPRVPAFEDLLGLRL